MNNIVRMIGLLLVFAIVIGIMPPMAVSADELDPTTETVAKENIATTVPPTEEALPESVLTSQTDFAAKTDEARIAGVSVTVDGITYTHGNVTITSTSTIVFTVSGTNFENLSTNNWLSYGPGFGCPVIADEGWEIDTDTNTASADFSSRMREFLNCDYSEVSYSNADFNDVGTGIYLYYDDSTAAKITDVSVTVDGKTYTTGRISITPDTKSVVFTVTGTNFRNLTHLNELYFSEYYSIDVTSDDGWTVDDVGNTATFAISTHISEVFAEFDNYEVLYSNDGFNGIGTGIFLTYSGFDAPAIKTSIVGSSGKIKVSWNKVTGAEKYEIYRSTSKSGGFKLVKTTTAASYTDNSAEAGKLYYYKVKAVSSSGKKSNYSNASGKTCDLVQPTLTSVVVESTGKLKQSWNKIDGAIKYEVYRATSKNGTYKLMKSTTSTSYTNNNAEPGVKYYYKVKAVHSNKEANSAFSNVVGQTCDLAKPVVSIKLNANGKPYLTWGKVEGATGYRVYRATSVNGTYKLLKTTTSLSFNNNAAEKGKTYYYKIRAIHSNTSAFSVYSSARSIKSK